MLEWCLSRSPRQCRIVISSPPLPSPLHRKPIPISGCQNLLSDPLVSSERVMLLAVLTASGRMRDAAALRYVPHHLDLHHHRQQQHHEDVSEQTKQGAYSMVLS